MTRTRMAQLLPTTAMAFLSLVAACDEDPACEGAPEGVLVSLVDHRAWRIAEPGEDPWLAHRPEDVSCPEGARSSEDFAELPSFGVDTGLCPYTTVTQPTTTAICEGEALYVWLWRFQLTGPEGAEATMAVALEDDVVWQQTVPIPARSALVALTVPVPPTPAGTPIRFHVRNHGDNGYQLLGLMRCRGACTPAS
jgi:hypothetical protein